MIKVCYSELDGPKGLSLRLEAAGHAGYAPAGQDIVCAGASTLMQALVYLLAGEESARSDAWDEPEGPRLAVAAQAPVAPWVQGAFELAKAGFTLLAERYPDNLRFADVSRSGQQSMMDLQLFAEGEVAPALSPEQSRQAVAAGTLKPEAPAAQTEVPQQTPAEPEKQPETPAQPERPVLPPLPLPVQNTVRSLHARWAAEEAAMRRSQPGFDLKAEPGDAPSDAAARHAGAGRLPPCPLRGCPAYHGTDRGAGGSGAGAAARRASAGKRPAPRRSCLGTAGRSRYDPRPAGSLGAPCAARCTNRTLT